MDTLTELTATPLSPALGAEVRGIDLGHEMSDETVAQILDLWRRYLVLVFRDQDLSTEGQRAFASNFGTLRKRRRDGTKFAKSKYALWQGDPNIRDDTNLMLVSNITIDGLPIGSFAEGDMWFHIDSGYSERPYKYTFLHAIKLPTEGGNTLFANMYRAYETLPPDLKDKLKGCKALHIHEYKRREKIDLAADFSKSPHAFHPVFTTHPETGRKSLFVDRLMTARLEGFEAEVSAALLDQLFDHAESPKNIYEHIWRPGDLLMWDNRCVTHGRTNFPRDQERVLRRCTIEGEPPLE